MDEYRLPGHHEHCPECDDPMLFMGWRTSDLGEVWMCLPCDKTWPPADGTVVHLYHPRRRIEKWFNRHSPLCMKRRTEG